jgi:hypothetical protein
MMPPPFAGDGDPGDEAPAPEPAFEPAPPPGPAFEPVLPPMIAPPPVDELVDAAAAPAPAIGGDLRNATEPATPLGGLTDPARAARLRAAAADRAARQRLRGIVRDARAHAQAILDGTPPVRAALKLTDVPTRDAELEKALKEFRRGALDEIAAIENLRIAARKVLDGNPGVYDAIGDAVTNLETAWARARRSLDQIRTADAAEAASLLDDLDEDVGTMLWQAAVVTMPSRVNEHLVTLDVGGQLDFGEAFSDELPTAPARRRFLQILKSHPGSVTGEVDVERGVIYKAATGPRRIFSYVLLVLLVGPGAWLFIGFLTAGSSWLGVPATWLFATNRHDELWAAYLFVVAGVLFHLLVEAVKQAQRSTDQAFLALGHWLTWIHVRETSLAITVLTMWMVPIGLALTLPAKIDVPTAFFAGYSIDSIIGIFLTRFDGLAKTSDDALLKRLRPTEPATAAGATVTVPTA